MPSLLEEYRLSLKLPRAEELLDILFYRPIAYLFVKLVYRTPLTPNLVTLLSLGAGLMAAVGLSTGTPGDLLPAAIWYAAANVLDCADGQLARLQKSGTPLGRIIDGLADYVSSIAIFLAIGIGLSRSGNPSWLLVVAAGFSSALHAVLFDRHQSEYIASARNEDPFGARESERFRSEISRLEHVPGQSLRIAVLGLYLRYLAFQQRSVGRPSGRTATKHIRLWSFLGPTTNRTALIAAAVAGRIDFYLWGVVIVGNCWLAVCALAENVGTEAGSAGKAR